MSEHPYTNRLIHEKSPYLLQHSHNPVDWYSWGVEAFEKAQAEDKPIFLSIGYATCHWCHVMEKESFQNIHVAKILNETFVNIKVDREELPEVDSLYMEFAQGMMLGASGWPLNLVLTPDLMPFYATTYMAPTSSPGLMGVDDLVDQIKMIWDGEEREAVLEQAASIVDVFAETVFAIGDGDLPSEDLVDNSAELFYRMADPVYGGIKGEPKFPLLYLVSFYIGCYASEQDVRAVFLVNRTLEGVLAGGIYDHLGGGISRYSTDAKWMVPHFEKMLYDNAILASACLEAWQLEKAVNYRQKCEETLDYILRDMTFEEGGFFSAEDADSDGKEGLFYTWTKEEIEEVLGIPKALEFCEAYGVRSTGNFYNRNILHCHTSYEVLARVKKKPVSDLQSSLVESRTKLWEAREKRSRPFKDDKILTSWNGLMIHALAHAGAALNETRYQKEAVRCAEFIRKNMWKDGRLLRRWRDGDARFAGGLEDYAFLIKGLISLFETGQGTQWLTWAIVLCDILEKEYKAPGGAFYQTGNDELYLVIRKCVFSDGAEPSGNAVHMENLVRLHGILGDQEYLKQAEDILSAVRVYIESYPPGYGYYLIAFQAYASKQAPLLVFSLPKDYEGEAELRQRLFQRCIPHKQVVWRHSDDKELFQQLPITKTQEAIQGKPTLYLCCHGVCKEPVSGLEEIERALDKISLS
jgi:uncharacterized protein YyaL (SSP411 family)